MEDKRKIFITGGTGFIGRALTLALKAHSIKFGLSSESSASIIPKEFPCIELEKLRPADIKNYDVVIHLAGRVHKMNDNSSDSLLKYQKCNTDLTLRLGKISLEAGVKKMVFASSVKAGNCEGKRMAGSQNGKRGPGDDYYGHSKLEAESALENIFNKEPNSKCLVFRLPLVYGPGVKGNVLRLLIMAEKGNRLPLKAAKGKRSMLYVGNLCDAFLKVVEDETSGRPSFIKYYLTDGDDLTSNEMYSMIYKKYRKRDGTFYLPEPLLRLAGSLCSGLETVTGKNLPINSEAVSRLFDEYRFSSRAFCDDYNWKPPYTPEEGITDTVKWFQSNNR